ncbi:class F sortase [Arthrobacter sp. 135MFCol5.1]|uniref:class F sortase n=1 Tax=Arthrobacter sp. 135MFCol5.1 TaxID=1158050 RepID=UPI0004758763|nr:class F sortase [Arthrobacter sp. 135MFCol5.1]
MTASSTTAPGCRRRHAAGGGAAALVAAALVLSGCGLGSSGGAGNPGGEAVPMATMPPGTGSPGPALSGQEPTPTGPGGTAVPVRPVVPPAGGIPVRPATAPAAPAVSAPTSLTVAGTAIDMPVVPGGVSAEGVMEIPEAFNRASWYKFGPAPGAAEGTAVIAGHIDTTSDRAPFSALKSLAAGTVIRVGRDGAPPVTYRVVGVEMMAKDKFDGGALFRRSGPHELKLVTCGGRWLDERMDYSDNVIVTAVPA